MNASLLRRLALTAVAVTAPVAARAQDADYTADFRVTSAGLGASTIQGSNPWTYQAGLGWYVNNVTTVARSRLFLPTFTSTAGGAFALELTHAFDFERGVNTAFDGGIVLASVNGGAFAQLVPTGGAGYTATMSTGFSNPIGGLPAFTGNSNGYVTSVFGGTLNMGDQIQFAFDGTWDSSVEAGDPGWVLQSVSADLTAATTATTTPEPGTWALMGTGLLGVAAAARRRRRA